MNLPPDVIVNQITTCCIFHFKDKQLSPDAPSHYHVVMPLSNGTDVILCRITSKVGKRKEVWNGNIKALDSLLIIDDRTLPFLNTESVIDCNKAELLTKKELIERVDIINPSETRIIDWNIPDNLKKRIIISIQNSPIIKKYIQESLSLIK